MTPARQKELAALLKTAYSRTEINDTKPGPFLSRIKFFLLEAGEKIYQTNNLLADQLRKFLDDQAYLQNRRIMELIRGIERTAIELKEGEAPKPRDFMDLADLTPEFDLPMGRRLYVPSTSPVIADVTIAQGTPKVSLDLLYDQTYVDENRLRKNIEKMLQRHSQISLRNLLSEFPLERGLAEAVAYVKIASQTPNSVIDDTTEDLITYPHPEQGIRRLRIPRILFVK